MKTNIEFYVSNEEIIKYLIEMSPKFKEMMNCLDFNDEYIFRIFSENKSDNYYLYIGKDENTMYFLKLFIEYSSNNRNLVFHLYNYAEIWFIRNYNVYYFADKDLYEVHKLNDSIYMNFQNDYEIENKLYSTELSLFNGIKFVDSGFEFKYE